jgi:hypothetical protein
MFAEPRNAQIVWPNPDNAGQATIVLVLALDATMRTRKSPAKSRRG